MCDYSLINVSNRLAVEGEELVIYRFPTRTIGLAAAENVKGSPTPLASRTLWSKLKDFFHPPVRDPVTAVCIPPGAQLMLREIPERLRGALKVRATETVVFTQFTTDEYCYRDAVRFANGHEVLLQELNPGQRVRVLSLDDVAISVEPEA